MSTSPILLIDLILESQNHKEVTANEFITAMESSFHGYLAKAMTDANLTLADPAEACRYGWIEFTGALTADRNVIVPARAKVYIIKNATTGGHAITVKTPSGTGIAVAPDTVAIMASNGTNVVLLATPSAADFAQYATKTGVQQQAYDYAADTGAADAYSIALTPAVGAYTDGLCLMFKATHANTGVSTLAVNGLAAKAIRKLDGTVPLAGGDIAAGQIVCVVYDSTTGVFQMQSQIAQLTGPVTTVFGRGGSVVATTGDYTAAQITNALDMSATRVKNTVLVGPTTGSDAAPSFRALVKADLPAEEVPISCYLMGKPAAGAIIFDNIIATAHSFPAALTGSTLRLAVNPTGTSVYSFKKNGTEFGTLSIASTGVGTWASASGATFNGTTDYLQIVAPAVQDATLAGVGICLKATR